jgi:hypothetical protein
MSAPTPITEPASIRAGDSASWQISDANYLAGDGWGLTYTFINAAGKFSINSAANGNAHLVHVLPAVTALYVPGDYAWQCVAANGTDAYTIRSGNLEVVASFAATATLDARSHAVKTLAALEAWIENHDLAVAKYAIAGREMQYIPIEQLLTLRDKYRNEVRREQVASGAVQSGRVYLRF